MSIITPKLTLDLVDRFIDVFGLSILQEALTPLIKTQTPKTIVVVMFSYNEKETKPITTTIQ